MLNHRRVEALVLCSLQIALAVTEVAIPDEPR